MKSGCLTAVFLISLLSCNQQTKPNGHAESYDFSKLVQARKAFLFEPLPGTRAMIVKAADQSLTLNTDFPEKGWEEFKQSSQDTLCYLIIPWNSGIGSVKIRDDLLPRFTPLYRCPDSPQYSWFTKDVGENILLRFEFTNGMLNEIRIPADSLDRLEARMKKGMNVDWNSLHVLSLGQD
jgi:hypothetical protein